MNFLKKIKLIPTIKIEFSVLDNKINVISRNKVKKEFFPYIYIENVNGKRIVREAGSEFCNSVLADKYDLFLKNTESNRVNMFDIFSAYLKYIILKSSRSWNIFKPGFDVYGIDSLAPIMNGYEYFIIDKALMQSGASSVSFYDDSGNIVSLD